MSKVGYIQRYLSIIRHIRNHRYVSMEDLINYVENDIAYYDDTDSIGTSERTIKRDLSDIRRFLGISICYSKYHNGYYIPEDEDMQSDLERVLEPLDLFSSIYERNKRYDFVFPESRKSKGTENIRMLIHAIQSCSIVEFVYIKFDGTDSHVRKVEPYGLKEFKGRWYLLAVEIDGNPEEAGCIKTWGLDRIHGLKIKDSKFQKDASIDIAGEFRDVFGIYSDKDKPIEEVILSFPPMGGKYNDAFPLHPSQETIADNDKEFRIRLNVRITYDFIIELLSQSEDITVIAPKHLKESMTKIYLKAIDRFINS